MRRVRGGAPPDTLFAICPPGLEAVVAEEITEAGFARPRSVPGGVLFEGPPLPANRLLATPSRILMRIARFDAPDFAALQRGLAALSLGRFGATGFTPEISTHASRLYHTGAIAERVSAIVPAGPLGLYLRFERDVCSVSVDTSGELLHRRGWREETGPAPLRETLAAALLRLAGWRPGEALYDPMCGSGTFLIEAAGRAAGLPPGRGRHFPCETFDGAVEAGRRPPEPVPALVAGSDRARPAVESARRNAVRAGVELTLDVLEAAHARPPAPTGLLVTNPPYDRRAAGASHALERLRVALDGPFAAWRAAVLHPDASALAALGRPVQARHELRNGGLRVCFAVLAPRSAGSPATPREA